MQAETVPLASIYGLFFLSGACTLVYEIVWVRMLVLVFGTSVYAVSTVLTAFMAGLALGSFAFGPVADRKINPLKIYAFLELGIGTFALVFPFLLARVDDLYTVLYRTLPEGSGAFHLVRFAIGLLLLLVPTTLMGATLPVLSKFATRRLTGVGRTVGTLYAVNTFGAALGCLAAAFFLMEQLGVRGTCLVAGVANLSIAAVAFRLGARAGNDAADGSPVKPPPTEPRRGVGVAPHLGRAIFWGYALSGLVALGYEVVWTRLMSVVLQLTTGQSLSIILVVFLTGLATGGAVGSRFVDRRRNLPAIFGATQLLLGLLGLASILVFGTLPRLAELLGFLPSWWGHYLRLLLLGFVVMLPPTFLMGLLFPVVGRIHVDAMGDLGRRVGNVYAVNTVGAIAGASLAGFVLIPLLGTQRSIECLAWVNLATGLTVVRLLGASRAGLKTLTAALVIVAALAGHLLMRPALLIELLERSQGHSVLLHYDENVGGTVTVYELADGKRLLRVNGAGEVPTDLASIRTFRLLGNLPMLLHPDPQEVLVVAFGGGVTLAAVERHRPRHIDCVEVVPAVIGAAPYFADYNNGIAGRLGDGRLRMIYDDGRNHVLRTDRSYDVLISDATHPGTADSWVLYTREFYRLCRRRLNEGGIVAQWLPLHGLSDEDYRMILRTFRSVFPHASLWMTREYCVLLGTQGPLAVDYAKLERRLSRTEIGHDLAEVDLGDATSFLSALALDERALDVYVGPGPINTDDRPYISFANRFRGQLGGAPILRGLVAAPDPLARDFVVNAGAADLERLDRRRRAHRHTVKGELAMKSGQTALAFDELEQALRIDPDEMPATRLLRGMRRARGLAP